MSSLGNLFDKEKHEDIFKVRNVSTQPDIYFDGNTASVQQSNGLHFDANSYEAIRSSLSDTQIEEASSVITVKDDRGFHHIIGEFRK